MATTQSLSKEQEAFLEECLLEFSDRYTDADVEYKEAYDTGIPPPPIMYPWYSRPKFNENRHRDGSRKRKYENDYRDSEQHWNDRGKKRYYENHKHRPY